MFPAVLDAFWGTGVSSLLHPVFTSDPIACAAALLDSVMLDDNYVNISPSELAANVEESFALLPESVRWAYEKDGSKADLMTDQVTSLGVCFDLEDPRSGKIYVSNRRSL